MKRPHYLALLAGLLSGLAMYAWADPLPRDDTTTDPGIVNPICLNCSLNGQLLRNKTAPDPACTNEWGPDFPRRYYVGRCARYQCDYGYYYTFEGWTALPLYNCTNIVVNDPETCPGSTCLYIPIISDLRAIQAGSSGSKASCAAGHTVPTGPLTTAYASQIVRGAMASDGKK
jgi:hypothetical protein